MADAGKEYYSDEEPAKAPAAPNKEYDYDYDPPTKPAPTAPDKDYDSDADAPPSKPAAAALPDKDYDYDDDELPSKPAAAVLPDEDRASDDSHGYDDDDAPPAPPPEDAADPAAAAAEEEDEDEPAGPFILGTGTDTQTVVVTDEYPPQPNTVRDFLRTKKDEAVKHALEDARLDAAQIQAVRGLSKYAALVKSNARLLRPGPRDRSASSVVRRIAIERAIADTKAALVRIAQDPAPDEPQTRRPLPRREEPPSTARRFGGGIPERPKPAPARPRTNRQERPPPGFGSLFP
jgi:hypothetical protein